MKMKQLLVAILSLTVVVASAQKKTTTTTTSSSGLITNGNFDNDFNVKELKGPGLVTLAAPWFSPTTTVADLYLKGAKNVKLGIPSNEHGTQDASSGSSYAGFRAYSKDPKKSRSYIEIKLNQKLEKGKTYCIRFDLSLSELSKFAVNNVGAYVSVSKMQSAKAEDAIIKVEPHVTIMDNVPVNIMDSWEHICGTFTANGNEEYLVIGGFGNDDKMKVEKMKKPTSVQGTVANEAYYYIDNVDVVAIEAKSQCNCSKISKPQANFIYSSSEARQPNATPKDIINSTSVYFGHLDAEVPGQFDESITEIVGLLKANPMVKIELTGHCDSEEMDEAKLEPEYEGLALKRAESVKAVLVAQGINGARITTVSVDAANPKNTMGTPSAHAQNRRVVFVVK